MAGVIKHAWNGTILAITSDSGTSSMDLKGPTGDIGPRGPQGPCGVIYNEDGVILADNLATEEYVDWKADEILSKLENRITIYSGTNLHYNYVDANEEVIETNYINFDNTETVSYRFRIVYADGTEEIIDTALKDVSGVTGADLSEQSERLAAVLIGTDGKLAFFAINGQETDYIEKLEIISITKKSSADIDLSGYATVDYVNSQLENVELDLTGYATEAYVTEKIVEVATGGTITLDGYATEEYVDEKVAASEIELINYASKDTIYYEIDHIGLDKERVIADVAGLTITDENSNTDAGTIFLSEGMAEGYIYHFTITYSDGAVDDWFTNEETVLPGGEGWRLYSFNCPREHGVGGFQYHCTKHLIKFLFRDNTNYTITSFRLAKVIPAEPLNPQTIPVDNETLKINEEGKIYCDSVDLTDYATKTYVAETVVKVVTEGTVTLDGYATEEYVNNTVTNYYTKEEVDALIANVMSNFVGIPYVEEVEY